MVQAPRLGDGRNHLEPMGCRHAVPTLPAAKAHHRNTTHAPRNTTEPYPHLPNAGLHPHREAMHKQHTEPGPSCCVPFGDPHVNKVTRSENQAGMHPQQRTHMVPVHHVARTHQIDDKSQEKKKERGASAKGSVRRLTCVPLPHLALPLSGCACSGTQTKATRGEARSTHDSGPAAIRVPPCQTSNAKSAMAHWGSRRYDWGDGRDHHGSLGRVAMLYQPRSQRPNGRNNTNTTRTTTEPHPHPQPSPTLWVIIVGPTTSIATHATSPNNCAHDGRNTIGTCCPPGPDIATVWA